MLIDWSTPHFECCGTLTQLYWVPKTNLYTLECWMERPQCDCLEDDGSSPVDIKLPHQATTLEPYLPRRLDIKWIKCQKWFPYLRNNQFQQSRRWIVTWSGAEDPVFVFPNQICFYTSLYRPTVSKIHYLFICISLVWPSASCVGTVTRTIRYYFLAGFWVCAFQNFTTCCNWNDKEKWRTCICLWGTGYPRTFHCMRYADVGAPCFA